MKIKAHCTKVQQYPYDFLKLDSMIKQVRANGKNINRMMDEKEENTLSRAVKRQITALRIYMRDKTIKLDPDMLTLFSLPSALRKTVIALYKLEKATADDLSNETKRLRAVESASANQLVRMGFVSKKREGRKVYFYIK